MIVHGNAKLGLAGRLALVQSIEAGMSLKAAAGESLLAAIDRSHERMGRLIAGEIAHDRLAGERAWFRAHASRLIT